MTALYIPPGAPQTLIRVVLDTNVVLDAWWFEDMHAAPWRQAVETGRLQWVATAAMRDELADVLGRPAFAGDPERAARVAATFDRQALILADGGQVPVARCADPDDQMFIDLALAAGARWLVSRDGAVLALARTARAWGCDIVAPADWPGTAAAEAAHNRIAAG